MVTYIEAYPTRIHTNIFIIIVEPSGPENTDGFMIILTIFAPVTMQLQYTTIFLSRYVILAKIIGKAVIGDKETICTETFLAIGPFSSKQECINIVKYAETKFFRIMVGIRKNKNMTRDTYKFVPLQDFTSQSDIDWSVSIPEIDEQLYQKYGLSDDEIAFIEKMIKPM